MNEIDFDNKLSSEDATDNNGAVDDTIVNGADTYVVWTAGLGRLAVRKG